MATSDPKMSQKIEIVDNFRSFFHPVDNPEIVTLKEINHEYRLIGLGTWRRS